MVLLSVGPAHGYAIVGELADLGSPTARSTSARSTARCAISRGPARSGRRGRPSGSGPARREYELTAAGYAALDEWAAVTRSGPG